MSTTARPAPVVFDVAGMDCADCARSVEHVVARLPLVGHATVNVAAATVVVTPTDAMTPADELHRAVRGAIDRAGYVAAPRIDGERTVVTAVPWWRNRRIVPPAIGSVVWLAAFIILHMFHREPLATALFLATIVIGGYSIARAALASLQVRRLDMNVLMTISVIGAAALGEWSEGALVVVLFSIGTTLQALAFERTRGAIRGLLDQAPDEAQVLRAGVEMTVAARTLEPGDMVLVRPGDRLPADGEVMDGISAVQQAAITGESLPVSKSSGDHVFAGTINGTGALTVRVLRPVSQSMLANIVHLVEEAQATKAPSQQLVDRFSNVYTPVVVLVASAIALAGWLLAADPGTWFYRALVLLVIACPCALVISTPVSIVSAIGAATRMGALVKGGAALEDLARIRTMAFDKTGTLTLGRPTVTAIVPVGDRKEADVLAMAAAIEGPSEHPLARAIVSRALHDSLPVSEAREFTSFTGMGASAIVGRRRLAIGSERLLDEWVVGQEARAWISGIATSFGERGETALLLMDVSDPVAEVLGIIGVADRLRPGAGNAILQIRNAGVRHVAMLSGDREAVANAIGSQLGIDEVFPELLPTQKSAAIEHLQARGLVAMVGDGINDAPALATANVGVAMGLGGTDVALESADVVLMRDDLGTLASTVDLAQRTLAIIRQNVTLSLVTKVLALSLGVLGFVSLWIAVLVDVGTSLLVTFNGLRLARIATRPMSAAPVPIMEEGVACACGEDHDHHQAQVAG